MSRVRALPKQNCIPILRAAQHPIMTSALAFSVGPELVVDGTYYYRYWLAQVGLIQLIYPTVYQLVRLAVVLVFSLAYLKYTPTNTDVRLFLYRLAVYHRISS